MFQAETEMSDFVIPPEPDPKDPVSVRMPASLKAKILWIVQLWRETAKAKGASQKQIDEIDFPYVHLRLLSGRADAELHDFGGFPKTEEQRAAQLKAVRDATKAEAKSDKKSSK